jgi:tetratricopeptide (TPR) repeat protein
MMVRLRIGVQPWRFLAATTVMVLAGCSSFLDGPVADYRTIAGEPNCDVEKAKAKNELAIHFAEKGRWDKAERALNESLLADVTFGPAHNNLGKLFFSQGKYYQAAWEFEYAHKLMPEQFEPLLNLGLVYETVGKPNEAIEMYGKTLELQPKNPEAIGNLARVRMRNGEPASAVRPLLSDLVFLDTRPAWTNWAREQLAMMRPTSEASSIETIPTPQGVPIHQPFLDGVSPPSTEILVEEPN